ncbi:twinkle protein, mitochondrial-like isoform X2 [Mizuhopecten yessoensis]|uniref:twinkle protein, mitochondrial-like isoform X2 n=1 Tax=Mizuhopecten yessoensis TaxID=6573 RepID=UPI000B45B697|nr:twinkle protein, mitochondrial-like isoform X2 [Mizuhopecten yessoensis]
MRKSYKLSLYYHKHTKLLHSGIIPNPAAGTALLKNGNGPAKKPLSDFTVSGKIRDGAHSQYGVLKSRNRTASSCVSKSNEPAPRQFSVPSLASSEKLTPTWSIVRYYLLKYKKYAQKSQSNPLKNVLEKLCPEVLTDVKTEFQINSREKAGARRKISNSKWQHVSLTQTRYRDEIVRGFIGTPTISINASRLFHSSPHLPNSDNITNTVDHMAFEEDFTFVEKQAVVCEDRYVPRNTKRHTADTLSLFKKDRHHLEDRTDATKSLMSRDHQFRNNDIHLPNLVLDSPHMFVDKTLPTEKEEKFHVADTETQRLLQKEMVEDSNDDFVSKSGSNGNRLNEMEPNLKWEDAVEEKDIGKVLEDTDDESLENGRNTSGNVNSAFDKNENNDLVQEKMKKRNKEKDDKSARERKNDALKNGGEKSVEEGKKRRKKLYSKSIEERTPASMGKNLEVNNRGVDTSYNSNKGPEVFKMVENIPSNISEAVTKYGLKPLTEGYTCLVTRCPKLPKKVNKNKPYGNLYINATSGHFQCDECQQHGTWTALKLNLENMRNIKRQARLDFPCMSEVQGAAFLKQGATEANRSLDVGIPLDQLEQSEQELVLEKFECENLSLSTLNSYNVKYHSEDQALLLPYYLADRTLISAKKLTCFPKEDSNSCSIEQEFTSLSGKCHLFGWNQISTSDDYIILTTSEFDAMAITETTKKKALALPMGISSIPIESLPDLERFKKILLWFENDLLSWKAAKHFAQKLNGSRCYIIRPSLETPGPYRALQQGLSLKNIIKNAHQIKHESIVSYSAMKNEVYSELANLEMVAGTEWKRYLPLNKILKGHRPGEMTVFTGPTGSGKTTFMSEYSLDLCESGVRTLWGSFEIPNVKLAKVMLTQFAKKNLSTHLDEFDLWSKKFEHLPLFFMTFHGHQSIQSVLDAMTHAVYVHDIEHIVVDNLQFMMGAMDKEKFFMQDRIISSFRNFATTKNCHITVVIHPRKEKEEELCTASVFGSAKATQEADNILILQDRRNTNPQAGKYIQVVKNRFDGDLGKMLLKFDKDIYTFSGKKLDTDRLKKQTHHQDNLVQNTEIEKHDDQSRRTLHSQNENGSEHWEADFPSDPEVKRFDYDTVNQAGDSAEAGDMMELSEDDDTKERLSY